jgi:release factor glutamine methyltransferase
MTVKEAMAAAAAVLKSAGIHFPVTDAVVMLSHTLGRDRAFLYAHDDYVLSSAEEDTFFKAVENRSRGMPVQYIKGRREFMSLSFSVNPRVLIPRQETEILVETAIKYAQRKQENRPLDSLDILDIGTGSGCIAVSLAYYIEGCHVAATDISQEALETAYRNAVENGVQEKVTFIKSDIFSSLESQMPDSRFDIIVSNPPYIPKSEIGGLQTEVRDYEPLIALDGGEDGLDFYRAIIRKAPAFLKPGGFLAFETGYGQAEKVKELMKKEFRKLFVVKDYSRIDRVVAGNLAEV